MSELTTRTEADAVIEQTLLGMKPTELHPDVIYAIRTPNGYATIDLTKEEVLKAAGFPRSSAKSSYAFHSVQSFMSYVRSVFDNDPEGLDDDSYRPRRSRALCIADEAQGIVRLIFDAQPNEWGTVYADLQLIGSSEAKRWAEASGRYMAQQDFAEFCELNLLTFSSPDPATILEIAQTFQAKSTVDFSSLELGVIPMRPRLGAAIASDRSDSYGELPQSLNPTMRPRVCTVIASDKTSA